jgi:hypothetical protein
MSEVSAETVQRVWIASLVVFAVVLGVVAVLLTLVLRTSRRITAGVAAIWTVGQRIANNTIHIALLDTTNHAAGAILHATRGIVTATAALAAHAERCPRCPACATGEGAGR